MDCSTLESLAKQLLAGQLSPGEFLRHTQATGSEAGVSVADGQVTLDIDRARRCGFPEVVFGEGKSAETIASVLQSLASSGAEAFATRVASDKAVTIARLLPASRFNPVARTVRLSPDNQIPGPPRGEVAVVTAGTGDLPVAEEARETLEWMGVSTHLVMDVGVAGPHRLPARLAELRSADAIVVVAGMEGALPSVVGGYVSCPVIGVPTSVGYGANFAGLSALLSMLNSCAANVAVVNIDAGFKAGYLAGMIARTASPARQALD